MKSKISRSQSETKCNKLLVIRISLSRKIIKRNSEIGVSNDKQSPQDVEVFFAVASEKRKIVQRNYSHRVVLLIQFLKSIKTIILNTLLTSC